MTALGFSVLFGGWLLWFIPFALARSRSPRAKAVTVDVRGRWGVVLEGVAYAILWMGTYWRRNPGDLRIALAALFAIVGIALAWGGTRALGKQWRVEAGLSADHDLVRSGPYRLVRHPIYASMFAMWIATCLMIGTWPRLLVSLILFLVGTEIRVRVEDALLESRFGEQAREFRREVSAYIPYVR